MRNALVTALTSCADRPTKNKARRFLSGLSFDELQFIAEFLGMSLSAMMSIAVHFCPTEMSDIGWNCPPPISYRIKGRSWGSAPA